METNPTILGGVPVRTRQDTRSLAFELCETENEGDWDAWRKLVAEDLIMDHAIGARVGIEANLAVMRSWRAAFEGYRRELFDVVREDDNVAFRFTITGRLIADARWGLVGGQPVELAGATFLTAREGLLVRAVALVTRNSLLGAPTPS